MSSCKGTAVFIVTITALFALVLPFITYVATVIYRIQLHF